MGGWKQKSGWIQIPPPLAFLSLFPFYLNHLSVSLSRVCAPTLPPTNKERYMKIKAGRPAKTEAARPAESN